MAATASGCRAACRYSGWLFGYLHLSMRSTADRRAPLKATAFVRRGPRLTLPLTTPTGSGGRVRARDRRRYTPPFCRATARRWACAATVPVLDLLVEEFCPTQPLVTDRHPNRNMTEMFPACHISTLVPLLRGKFRRFSVQLFPPAPLRRGVFSWYDALCKVLSKNSAAGCAYSMTTVRNRNV